MACIQWVQSLPRVVMGVADLILTVGQAPCQYTFWEPMVVVKAMRDWTGNQSTCMVVYPTMPMVFFRYLSTRFPQNQPRLSHLHVTLGFAPVHLLVGLALVQLLGCIEHQGKTTCKIENRLFVLDSLLPRCETLVRKSDICPLFFPARSRVKGYCGVQQ